jgi:signal transduction histidine kinase
VLFEFQDWISSASFTLALLNRPGKSLLLLIAGWLASQYIISAPPSLATLQADFLATLLILWSERTSKKEPNGVFRNLRATNRLLIRVLGGPLLISSIGYVMLEENALRLSPLLTYLLPRGALLLVLSPLASQLTSADFPHFLAQVRKFLRHPLGIAEFGLWLGINAVTIRFYLLLHATSRPITGRTHAEIFALDFLIAIPVFFSALRFPPLLNAICILILALRALLTAQAGLGPFWDLAVNERPLAVGVYILIFATIGNLLSTQQEESRTVREELMIRAEGRARELEAERIHASREREARESAERLVETRNHFLGMASHELKNPLSALLLTLELMERQIQPPASPDKINFLQKTARNAVSEARRMARLIDNMLDVTRLERGKLEHRPTAQISLSEILQCTIAGFEGLFENAGCATHVRIQTGIQATADPDQIQQVFQNLISNAIKFGRKKPIDITLEQVGTRWKLAVRDRGPGIRPELKDKIFEPYNITTDRRRYPGMGIGLHLSREIIRAHGGDITFTSTSGVDTLFTVTCPLSASAELPIHERKTA